VVKLATSLKAEEIIKKLIEIEEEFETTIKLIEPLRCYLMAYDQTVSISPSITLPHPLMMSDPGWMYCCFEVWKNYRHPILEQTLDKLLKNKGATNVEFHSQGRALLTVHNL
jgi:7,8-dihydro-6-hydroxymethylpterin-pyrophosphokinase